MEFAKVSEVKEGTKLRADDGFTCLKEGEVVTVMLDRGIPEYLYVHCSGAEDDVGEGPHRHYLDGQIEGDEYIGFTLA